MSLKSQMSIGAIGNTGKRSYTIKTGILYLILALGGVWHLLGLFTDLMTLLAGPILILLAVWIVGEFYSVLPRRKRTTFLVWSFSVMVVSLVIEIVGAQTGLIFGEYVYGRVLQPMVFGVPVAIGFAWVSILLASKGLAEFVFGKAGMNWFFRGLVVALFMVVFDLFLEQAAVSLGYWHWIGPGIPLQNYLAWFLLGALFSLVGERLHFFPAQPPVLAKHIYFAQLLYFIPVFFL